MVMGEISIDRVTVPRGRRPLDADTVKSLAKSMAEIGLKYPISVRRADGDLVLVAGRHRLAAAIKLGWKKIKADIEGGDEIDARIWEAAENVIRNDLSAHDRNVATKDLLAALEEKHAQMSKVSDDAKASSQKQGGLRNKKVAARSKALDEAAAMTGKSKHTLRTEAALANLTPEARKAITEAGLDGDKFAQATIARAGKSAEVQLEKLKAITSKPAPAISANPLYMEWIRAKAPTRRAFVLHVADQIREILAENE